MLGSHHHGLQFHGSFPPGLSKGHPRARNITVQRRLSWPLRKDDMHNSRMLPISKGASEWVPLFLPDFFASTEAEVLSFTRRPHKAGRPGSGRPTDLPGVKPSFIKCDVSPLRPHHSSGRCLYRSPDRASARPGRELTA